MLTRPCETGSAKLLLEAIYFREIVRLAGINDVVIQQMQSLQAGLWEHPFENALMTLVLSECILMLASL